MKNPIQSEKEHFARIDRYAKQIEQIYMSAATEAAKIGLSISAINADIAFDFKDYPEVKARIDKLINNLYTQTASVITQATEKEWLEACKKNDDLIASFDKTLFTAKQLTVYTGRNLEALSAFKSRKINGLNLSDKVWKYSNQFKGSIEMALDIGIGDGRSAAELSRDIRDYLQNPEKLFRRVRDKHGNLQLSKNAKAYSPGPGQYRSSYKNAMRLTRTEINMAYRASDFESNQNLDFVVGIEVKRSNHEYDCDICDSLKGKYPKDFKFVGFHPACRCFSISILATHEEFINQQKEVLAGNDNAQITSVNEVRGVPKGFTDWVSDNKDRIEKAPNLPYFLRDNKQYFK